MIKNKDRNLLLIMGLLVMAIYILSNYCFTKLDEKFNVKLDLTSSKVYEISDTTKTIITDMQDNVNIYVISAEDDYPSMFVEILSKYDLASSKVAVDYIDPYANPVFIDSYKQLGYSLSQNDILVVGTNKIKQIKYDDMMVYKEEEVIGINIENQITSSFLYVNNNETLNAAFIVGHNERISNSLQKTFENNNFDIKNLSLTIDDLQDADIAIISSPTKDFETQEIQKLESYLDNGGSLIIFMEPGVNEFSNLNSFLDKWNLGLGDNVILESKNYAFNNQLNVIPMYANHDIVKYFAENQYYLIMPSARSIEIKNNSNSNVETKPVLLSSANSYAKNSIQYTSAQKESEDKDGPFVLAATSQKNNGKIMLLGSRMVVADDIMKTETYANAKLLTESINYLIDKDVKSINIASKSIVAEPLNITAGISMVLGFVTTVVVPVLFLIAGLFVYLKRKSL